MGATTVTTVPHKPVSYDPDDMALTNLADLSLEEVFEMFVKQEKARAPDTQPESESLSSRHVRAAPAELFSSLAAVAKRLNTNVSVLTQCCSHQAVDWYRKTLQLDRICDDFEDIYECIRIRAVYTALRRSISTPARFSFSEMEVVDSHVFAPSWVFGDLGRMASSMGAKSSDLLLVGLVYGLTTMSHKEWDLANIVGRFSTEVREMRIRVSDREIDIRSLREKFAMRESLGAVDRANVHVDGVVDADLHNT